MKMTWPKIILVGIIVLGFVLRIVFLNVAPPGFNADEASLGYNAYSLLKTGHDEWGQPFPLVFKSFSDYKPGLYVYLAMPFIAVLGLTELAVRLPSIILGTLSIWLVYFMAKQMFRKEILALPPAFLLAVSPWHLHYSRGAWETNIATFFVLLGVYFFIRGLEKTKWMYWSAVAFILSIYTYQSPRLVVPALLTLLALVYFKKLRRKQLAGPIILALILVIPLAFNILSSKGLARFQGVSIFSDIGPGVRIDQDRGEHANPNDIWAKIYHNKATAYGFNFVQHYFDHFTSGFLFINGDPLGRNKVPEMGELYLFEMVTLVLGIFFLLRGKFENTRILFIWTIVAPLASALTYQTPHALRAESMVIPLTVISGFGLGTLLEKVLRFKGSLKMLSLAVGVLIIAYFIVRSFHQYFVHLPKEYALEWEYGFSQVVPYVMANKDNYDKVIFTDRYDQPYILVLFYSKYDPSKYQGSFKPSGVDKYGFSTVTSFDKFEFRPIGKNEIGKDPKALYVGTGDEIGDGYKPLKVINYPNGTPAFRIVGT